MTHADALRAELDSCVRMSVLCRHSSLQEEGIARLKDLRERASQETTRAIDAREEDTANELLAIEYTAEAMENELAMYLALKRDAATSAWTHLVKAQMAASHAVCSHTSASDLESEYIPRLHVMEKVLFPKQMFLSAGLVIEASECSICGSPYGECDHVKKRAYMGKLCARIITKPILMEVSLTPNPANKHCRAISITDDDGVNRDPLSLYPL
jgi:hypothetical protein